MKLLRRIGLYAGLGLAALTFIYPFLWMVSSTFKPLTEVGTLALIPDHFTLDNYRTMWARAPFGRALLNSTIADASDTPTDPAPPPRAKTVSSCGSVIKC